MQPQVTFQLYLLSMYKRIKIFFIGDCMASLPSIHDQSRLNLLFNLSLSVTLMGGVAFLISLIIQTYSVFVPALGNILFGLLTLFLIRRTKKFSAVAKFYFIVLYLLVFGNLNFNDGTMHIGAPFWIMLLNILVMYIIGVRWGVSFLVASLLGYLYYLHYVFPRHMDIMDTMSEEAYYSVYYEALFALFLLGFIIYTILRSSKRSDELLHHKNEELKVQNSTILLREEEKTTMLKEIHHRVKNNLQVITSLLRLQMYELENEAEAEKFKDSMNRVLTMAMIHEKIYQSEELSRINLEDYFKGLSQDLLTSYQTNMNVDLHFDLNIEKIGLKTIVPLALIYNELFSNSLKHAFKTTRQPKITVSLERRECDSFTFTYEDNGEWRSDGASKSFGRELINSLTDQLDGQMKFSKVPHTRYEFIFKHLEK